MQYKALFVAPNRVQLGLVAARCKVQILFFDKLEFVDYKGVPTSIKLPSKS